MKSLLAGIILGAAALVIAPHVSIVKHNGNFPIPLCPPDQPDCGLNR